VTQPTHPAALSVAQLNRYLRDLLQADQMLQDCWVEGEVSNYTQATSGHVYFTLKDETAAISCVMWRSIVAWQPYVPEHGDAVLCHGHVSVYEAQGRYQLYVDQIQPAGRGLLHLEFENLKQRLAGEGLFDAARKRPLPPFPRRIGVVTSPQAAALRDLCHILQRRYAAAEVVLAPTLVQGDGAPPQIVAALALVDRAAVDIIVLTRGGGSLEELWAFNDEGVARAIAATKTPVVCAVGHETDYTIADFVADLRAPTPSAAAELIVPDRIELGDSLKQRKRRLFVAVERQLDQRTTALGQQQQRLAHRTPLQVVNEYRQRVDALAETSRRFVRHRLRLSKERVTRCTVQLRTLDPKATLARGYAIVQRRDTGQPVTSVRLVDPGDALIVRISDGALDAIVRRVQDATTGNASPTRSVYQQSDTPGGQQPAATGRRSGRSGTIEGPAEGSQLDMDL
jgi:exodeoxyribonuclease VII large subunit